MSVQVLIDPFGVYGTKDGGEVIVDTQAEYVAACKQIDHAVTDGENLRVIVRNRAMCTWFDHFRDRAGVSISRCDPCDMMANALGISSAKIPAILREEPAVIPDLELIELAKRSKPVTPQSIEGWILDAKVGAPWGRYSIDTLSDLDDLLLYYSRGARAMPVHPALIALQQEVRSAWCSRGQFAELLKWLVAGETARRAEALIIARLMQAYPKDVRIEALQFESRWSDLCKLNELDEVVKRLGPFTRAGFGFPAGPNDVVRCYLHDKMNAESLKGIVTAISGFIPEEEKAVRSYLLDRAHEIDSSWDPDLSVLQLIFARNEAASQLVELISELRPVKEPPDLSPDASWGEVTSWLDLYYFSYYRWAVATSRIEVTAQSSAAFEKWLLRNYDGLSRSEALLAACLRQRIHEQAAHGGCIVVVVDGLPWYMVPDLSKLARRYGMPMLESSAKLSTLPTLTETAKPSLLRGQLPGQFDASGMGVILYRDLLAASIGISNDQIACGSSNEVSLFELVRSRKNLALYLFNNVDELIHKRLPADKRQARIQDELSGLLKDLSEACDEYRDQNSRGLYAFIVSDHGYTEMPAGAGISLPVPDGCSESHGRVVFGPVDRIAESETTIVIDPHLMGGGSTAYGVARCYNYYGSKPHGATHGGVTPQEVVVPFLVLTDEVKWDFKECEMAIIGDVYRGRQRNAVEIHIVNPNAAQIVIENLSLRLTTISQDGPWVLPPHPGRTQMAAEIDASNVRSQELQIIGTLALSGPMGRQNVQVSTTLATKGAAIADTQFEQDFEL